MVIVPPLSIPGAGNECRPSLGAALPLAGTFRYLGHSTDVIIKDAGGTPVTQFKPPLKICFRYNQPELAAVNGNPANFLIQTFQHGAWESLPTMPEDDPASEVLGRVCAPVNHLTLFALFSKDEEKGNPFALLPQVDFGRTNSNLSTQNPAIPGVKYLPETGVGQFLRTNSNEQSTENSRRYLPGSITFTIFPESR